MLRNMNINKLNQTIPTLNASPQTMFQPNQKFESLFGIQPNLIVNSEVYTMMKENSLFLLELSSTGPGGILSSQKRSPLQMPVVTETQLHQIASDLNKPSTSRGGVEHNTSFNKPNKSGLAFAGSNTNNKAHFNAAATPYRRSEVMASPELLWQVPETFACLDSLGVSITNNTAYTIFDINSTENGFERVSLNV